MDILDKTSLPSFVKEFLFHLVQKKRKSSTIRRYIYDLEDFFLWLHTEKKDLTFSTFANLSSTDINNYFNILTKTRNYQPRTTKRIQIVLNQLYKYYDNQGLSKNPIHKISKIEIGEPLMMAEDFLTEQEIIHLFTSIRSYDGLSENQLKTRHFIVNRNEGIFILFLYYGLTLQELTGIQMTNIHFETNSIDITNPKKLRQIKITPEHKQILYKYYHTIPIPVRPRYHEDDPFFVAFDFQRGTYRWVYDNNKPKRLTNIAIQRMIQKEITRSGLRKGISAQHFRNTFILKEIEKGKTISLLKEDLGLQTDLSLNKFFRFSSSQKKSAGAK
ncbi:hypothetical protein BKP37_11250 [Anaerobacillus alkalilacustris]|uniref:Integrase n=1 Tax=Anaerobacillus alkalilacustris TaxID=393763 RepID=A0A1S2LLV1_9BACI|nr:phage integrase N-terminal SAM-like domain-containing protein [Anaerobacillus alkalilacustris]OIJ13083.1 hypothetical protein BKP37_11250 [Anaerobacillus alkalilacustris]